MFRIRKETEKGQLVLFIKALRWEGLYKDYQINIEWLLEKASHFCTTTSSPLIVKFLRFALRNKNFTESNKLIEWGGDKSLMLFITTARKIDIQRKVINTINDIFERRIFQILSDFQLSLF